MIHANEARENPNPFFRRAVKVVDGNLLTGIGTCPGTVPCGLAIATENPAYIQGDFNANSGGNGFNDPNVAVSVNADAVTLLSNNFNDVNSFAFPYTTSNRKSHPAQCHNHLLPRRRSWPGRESPSHSPRLAEL